MLLIFYYRKVEFPKKKKDVKTKDDGLTSPAMNAYLEFKDTNSAFRSLLISTMIAKMHSHGMMLSECCKPIMQEIQAEVGDKLGFRAELWPTIFQHTRGNSFFVRYI